MLNTLRVDLGVPTADASDDGGVGLTSTLSWSHDPAKGARRGTRPGGNKPPLPISRPGSAQSALRTAEMKAGRDVTPVTFDLHEDAFSVATAENDVKQRRTTELDLEPALTTQLDIEPALTSQLDFEPSLTTHLDLEPALTTHLDFEPSLTTHLDFEPALTTHLDIEPTLKTQFDIQPSLTTHIDLEPPLTYSLPQTNHHFANATVDSEFDSVFAKDSRRTASTGDDATKNETSDSAIVTSEKTEAHVFNNNKNEKRKTPSPDIEEYTEYLMTKDIGNEDGRSSDREGGRTRNEPDVADFIGDIAIGENMTAPHFLPEDGGGLGMTLKKSADDDLSDDGYVENDKFDVSALDLQANEANLRANEGVTPKPAPRRPLGNDTPRSAEQTSDSLEVSELDDF